MAFVGPPPQSDREYLIRIYDATQAIKLSVADLCKRVDGHDGRLDTLEDASGRGESCAQHTEQISGLQKWRWAVTGGLSVVVLLASWALGHLKGWF